jgi:hypothetical protein
MRDTLGSAEKAPSLSVGIADISIDNVRELTMNHDFELRGDRNYGALRICPCGDI